MAETSRLRRLCDLRRLEEQNSASQLQAAKTQHEQLEEALEKALSRERTGRALVEASIRTGLIQDRVVGVEEIASAIRLSKVLMARKRRAQENVQRSVERYLAKRTKERCQAEALLRVALEDEVKAAHRRNQAALDEWHRLLHHGPTQGAIEDNRAANSTIRERGVG